MGALRGCGSDIFPGSGDGERRLPLGHPKFEIQVKFSPERKREGFFQTKGAVARTCYSVNK